MGAFVKSIKKADQVRTFTIQPAASGWEVREEQGDEVIRQRCYQDWHRVERARRAFTIELISLREEGWQEVG